MATMNPNITERRHGLDRRSHSGDTTQTRMNTLDWVALALMIVGGLNWGLIGLFSFDLVAALFGDMSALTRVVYTAVGLSALYSLYTASKMSHRR